MKGEENPGIGTEKSPGLREKPGMRGRNSGIQGKSGNEGEKKSGNEGKAGNWNGFYSQLLIPRKTWSGSSGEGDGIPLSRFFFFLGKTWNSRASEDPRELQRDGGATSRWILGMTPAIPGSFSRSHSRKFFLGSLFQNFPGKGGVRVLGSLEWSGIHGIHGIVGVGRGLKVLRDLGIPKPFPLPSHPIPFPKFWNPQFSPFPWEKLDSLRFAPKFPGMSE